MSLEIILGRKALRPGTSTFTASKWLAVLQMVLSKIYVNTILNQCSHARLTVHQMDSSILYHKLDMVVLMTLMILELCVARHG